MWPTGCVRWWQATAGPGIMPSGPALTTLRSMVAYLASMVRCAGIAYTVVQVVIWHSFYTANSWRLAGPLLAVAWAATATVYLRRGWPPPPPPCPDSAVCGALRVGRRLGRVGPGRRRAVRHVARDHRTARV